MSGVISVGELRGYITLTDQFSGPLDKIAKALGVSSKSLGAMGAAAGLAVGTIAATTAAVVALGTRGAEVADVQSAFENLASAAGESADVMLGKLQEGTLGTINNFDLMKVANKALGSGLVKSSEDMGTLAAGAQLLADRTGGDTKVAFESLMSAIASGKTAQLKQLGLFVDSKVAIGEFADELGKTAGKLTGAEKAQALSVATLKALREQLAAGGKSTADFGDNIARGKVLVENFTDNLGVAIATSPVVGAGMKAMGDALQGAFGGNQQDTVKKITGFVNQFAIFLVDAAEVAVEGARIITNAWSGVKFLFNTVLGGLTDALGIAGGAIAKVAEAAAKVPGAPQWLQDYATGASEAARSLSGMSASFKEQAEEALTAAGQNNAAFDTVQTALTNTRAAMVAAQGATVETTKAITAMGPAAAEAATRSADASKKILEAMTTLQNEIALAQTTGIENRLLEIQFAMEKEIAAAQALTGATLAEKQLMFEGISEKYDLIGQKALDSSAEILAITQRHQEEIAAATLAGLELKIAQLDAAKAKEIANLDELTVKYGDYFGQQRAAVEAHYAALTATTIEANRQMSESTIANYVAGNAAAQAAFASILSTGEFTYEGLRRAHEAYKAKEEEVENASAAHKKLTLEGIAANAGTILRTMFGRSKAAAIAAVIIDAAAAIVKVFAQFGFFGFIPAAAVAAATAKQISDIRHADFSGRFGTPGTEIRDFGPGTAAVLHGEEAVVTRRQAESVAGMVEDAIARGGRNGGGEIVIHNVVKLNERTLWESWERGLRTGMLVTG